MLLFTHSQQRAKIHENRLRRWDFCSLAQFNLFDEYSMVKLRELGEYFGFTEEVARQCKKHSVDYTKMKKWYDGYHALSTTQNPSSTH